ncbi:hypothetical protein M426DRAFT_14056 [Hypoxylon sp. CI-4A]|nr:hypothetical protein M426DRAFT_14056 [Hypoxylon sp. CI-4A]
MSTSPPASDNGIEPVGTVPRERASQHHYHAQVNRRRNNDKGIIENPLAHLTDEELQEDVVRFCDRLPNVDPAELLRAARVAQNIRSYDAVARSEDPAAGANLPVKLRDEEKAALKAERDVLFAERKMFVVILTVSLAAFLQGFVQSSINGASLYSEAFGLPDVVSSTRSNATDGGGGSPTTPHPDDWRLGATNASPFLFAALLGCWMALPVNDWIGRRGAMAVAACLIFASSLASAWCESWVALFCVRILNGIGMGVKAVSTPILASETAVGFWRGSSILAWQLWVAFGIMVGFAFNLIFYTAHDDRLSLQLILGAPLVPSIMLMVSLCFCPESPRYYMRRRLSDPEKALNVLKRLRSTELQALRDVYLIYKSVQLEEYSNDSDAESQGGGLPQGFFAYAMSYASQYKDLFTQRRLRNALISSSTVALAQQLCGINMFAFYSGTLFAAVLGGNQDPLMPMVYSLVYGAINFLFGLPAIRTIDTLGRRKWLVLTLPVMCLLMLAASLSSLIGDKRIRADVIALFVFLFTAAYSPGMGPIHFTLASESFPLSHREAGCAFAVAINLLFAGLIQMFFPSIYAGLRDGGSLGLFAALNFLAFVLVFLLAEETKRRSLEDLDLIFAVRKRDFVYHQVARYIPWFVRRYVLLCRQTDEDKPSLYVDLIWNGPRRLEEEERDAWRGVEFANDAGKFEGEEDVGSLAEGGRGRYAPRFLRSVSFAGSEESMDSAHR